MFHFSEISTFLISLIVCLQIIEQTSILDVRGNMMIPQVPFQLTTESNYYF
jgi:hypothetical protein